MTAARFEIVRGDAGDEGGEWFVRVFAANSRQTWRTSETYQRRAGGENAILSLATMFGIISPVLVENVPGREYFLRSALSTRTTNLGVQVLIVDERTKL